MVVLVSLHSTSGYFSPSFFFQSFLENFWGAEILVVCSDTKETIMGWPVTFYPFLNNGVQNSSIVRTKAMQFKEIQPQYRLQGVKHYREFFGSIVHFRGKRFDFLIGGQSIPCTTIRNTTEKMNIA